MKYVLFFVFSTCVAGASAAPAASRKNCIDPPETRTQQTFDSWLNKSDSNVRAVAEFQTRLDSAGVGDLIPMPFLVRAASRWEVCGAEPYAVPPPELQHRAIQTLKLAKVLKQKGILPAGEVASAYRGPSLNTCACGAPNSQHQEGSALDFYPSAQFGPEKISALCAFWRKEGASWKMGISQYASTRIHIDTGNRKRTWPANRLICSR